MTLLDIPPTTAPPETIPHPDKTLGKRPTRNQMIDAVVAETGCSRKRARRMVNYFRHVVNEARQIEYNEVFLLQDEIDAFHDLMDAVMPDDTIARPGTAHDTINRGVCDLDRGELGIVHTKGGDVALDCSTYVVVDKVG